MEKLIEMLQKLEKREIPVTTTFSQDFIDILDWSKNTKVDKDTVRQYLINNDLYSNEEDLEYFMRDLYTKFAIIHEREHRNQLWALVNSHLYTVEKTRVILNNTAVHELIGKGYKVYPACYDNNGQVTIGIITKVGNIIVQ